MSDAYYEHARQQIVNHKRALQYLDACRDFTFADLQEVVKLAGLNLTQPQLLQIWKSAPGADGPGQRVCGAKQVQMEIRKVIDQGLADCTAITKAVDIAEKARNEDANNVVIYTAIVAGLVVVAVLLGAFGGDIGKGIAGLIAFVLFFIVPPLFRAIIELLE